VLTISGGSVTNAGVVTIGATSGSFGNGLVVSNGGGFFGGSTLYVGATAGASNNYYNIGSAGAKSTVSQWCDFMLVMPMPTATP